MTPSISMASTSVSRTSGTQAAEGLESSKGGSKANVAEKAQALLSRLQEPVRFLTQEEEKKRNRQNFALRAKWLFSSFQNRRFVHFERLQISNKLQTLQLNLKDVLKTIPKSDQFDELLLRKITISWTPYISKSLLGKTTILLGDFRSKNPKNILKGGYSFRTSCKFENGVIYPGYLVSTKDPNLHKIFRFYIITNGLDLAQESFCGKLTLSLDCVLGGVDFNLPIDSDLLTIVTSKDSITIVQKEPVPMLELTSDLSIQDVMGTFEDFEEMKKSLFEKNHKEAEGSEGPLKIESIKDLNSLLVNPTPESPERTVVRRMSCSDVERIHLPEILNRSQSLAYRKMSSPNTTDPISLMLKELKISSETVDDKAANGS